jgi:hypothetical protein
MSDNEFVLAAYLETGNVQQLLDHHSGPLFSPDDDAGWEIRRLVQSPAFRPCACGSGRHWAICPEGDSYHG